MKALCSDCKESKELDQFHKNKSRPKGVDSRCIFCAKRRHRAEYTPKPNGWILRSEEEKKYNKKTASKLNDYKQKLRKRGIDSSLTLKEYRNLIRIENCEICNVVFSLENPKSLDRINNEKGYDQDNVGVICYRCNTIKSYGTAEEHRRIADWMDSKFNIIYNQ